MATLRHYYQQINELLSQDKSYEEIFNYLTYHVGNIRGFIIFNLV
jgi:hypothetical protein